ncbi:hypothetical protein ACHAWF_018804 [Thalassiosira exigua]
MAAAVQPGSVVYVDHARHLTPLTLCYHATASRHLTSGRSDVIPPSTSVEVDSAYCPRCLTFCDAASASSGVCQKDAGGCKDCPICFSPLAVSIDEIAAGPEKEGGGLVCHYLCSHCQWSSQECGVSSDASKLLECSSTDGADSTKEKELEPQRGKIIAEASKDLEACLQRRISERNQEGDSLFNSMVKMWGQREQEEQRRKRMNLATTAFKGGSNKQGEIWSLETLEQSLLEKRKDIDSLYTPSMLSPDEGGPDKTNEPARGPKKSRIPLTPQQTAAQMSLTTTAPQSRSDLFPLPVPFRARVSRRCRAELAKGKTGILIKPKLNPLEGDTSLRAGHGQWWKKDSSAIHVVPRVQLCRSGSDPAAGNFAGLLKVKNPTLNAMRLRLSRASSAKRESEDGTAISSLVIDERELKNILVDPFTETFVHGRPCDPDAAASISQTDFFVLNPADDPYLDVGKGQEDDPLVIRDWDAATALDSATDDDPSRLRVVATGGDTAWVEFVLRNAAPTEGLPSDYLAIPLALEIEVGNGSWEASLIKRRDLPEGEKDLVTINLVTLLR